ncbi:FUSC family protein [Leucobacter salsicius]|uniref:FUSC family protein n=1 Tax=Leucobacter salsicius TaxID=664638 RepID=UPI0003499951|nr:FUSC family protein [Leucobacter salsicius]
MRHGENDRPDGPSGAGAHEPGGHESNPPTGLITASRRAAKSLFALPPGPGPRGWIAFRAAISIGVPFAALTIAGHEMLGLQMATGAFTSLYSTHLRAGERARVLPFVGLYLIVCAALGTLLAPSTVWLLVGLVVVATVSSALAFAFRLGAPGPVFLVLMYGLAGSITGVDHSAGGAATGARHNDPGLFLLALTCGVAFSCLVACMPLLRRSERARPTRPLREVLPGPWLGPGERLLTIRIIIAAILGTVITAAFLDPHRAYWTVCASIAVVGLSAVRSYSIGRGLHRTVGTLLGAGLYLAIAPFATNPLVLVLMLAVLQFAIEFVVVRNYALALMFITPLVLLLTGAAVAGGDHVTTAGERVVDTVIGSAIAILTAALHGHRRR